MHTPKVSIIIVNWNAGNYLKDCINSLIAQTYKNFEIILVDNASSDSSVEFVEKNFPQVRVIRNKTNVGFAEGNNIGIRNSTSELISLFNPDAVADKDWLSVLIPVLQSSDKIAAVAGKLFYLGDRFGKDAVFCTWSKIDNHSAKPYNFYGNEPMSKVDYLTGAAMVIKREVIEKIGFLDPNYFLFFEETDWCARMIRAGYDLMYVPTAIAWHVVSGSVLDSNMKTYYMERNRIRFAIKNFDVSYMPIFWTEILIDTIKTLITDVKRRDFTNLKMRISAISWNLTHILYTTNSRKQDLQKLKQAFRVRSYNRSLPLREMKI